MGMDLIYGPQFEAAGQLNKDSSFTLPLILAASRQQTSIGGTDWGMLQAGITISIIPCMAFYLLLQKYYVAGLLNGAVK
jgi:multiple sugar transport system permease protein